MLGSAWRLVSQLLATERQLKHWAGVEGGRAWSQNSVQVRVLQGTSLGGDSGCCVGVFPMFWPVPPF